MEKPLICELIQNAFWKDEVKTCSPDEWEAVYKEAKDHGIELLFADSLSSWEIPADLLNKWKLDNLAVTSQNVQLLSLQGEIHKILVKEGIKYSILKGSAAAINYPRAIYRTFGDIDIIVQDEDFERTTDLFTDICGTPVIGSTHNGNVREYVFTKDSKVIELHQSYAILANDDYDKLLDFWIKKDIHSNCVRKINNKYTFFMPTETVNGLILLAHIAHHLEEGLGLRQIIDWMMYVDKCLSDEKWPFFQDKAEKIGLDTLAITATKMCQVYMGLPNDNIHWADGSDAGLCADLMDYVLSCGNFGRKQGTNNTVSMIVSQNQGITTLFKNLQARGESNWKALEKHSWLRPFAWMYQGCRYVKKGFGRKNAMGEFRKDLADGKKRDQLLKRMGVKKE